MIPKKLIESYKRGSFGIFVGSGLSRASGLPDWKQLLDELIDLAQEMIPSERVIEMRKLSKDSSKYLMLAEELREVLASDLQKHIKNRFDNKMLQPSDVLTSLVRLNYKFIITTNYDTLIEKAFVKVFGDIPNTLTYKDAATINYNIINGEKFILKAHGDARSAPSEIILTEKDYRNIIFRAKGYQSVLHVLFSTCNVLFLGASLRDPELNLLLGYIHNIFHGGSPDHFALINKDELTKVEEDRWRKDYNINIIPYDPKDDHQEVGLFVETLLKS
jgi:hypothetical protein